MSFGNPRTRKSEAGRRWKNFKGGINLERFSFSKFVFDENRLEIKSSTECKECAHASFVLRKVQGTILEADWTGPVPAECTSNMFRRTILIENEYVIVRTSEDIFDGYMSSYGCEYNKILIDDFIYRIAHQPDNLFHTESKDHKSVFSTCVKKLVDDQYSDDYLKGFEDGFDYSKEKSPAVHVLEDLKDTFNKVSILNKFIEKDGVFIILLYLEDRTDFELDNVKRMKIGDSIEY